jgi:hypothetical protein
MIRYGMEEVFDDEHGRCSIVIEDVDARLSAGPYLRGLVPSIYTRAQPLPT